MCYITNSASINLPGAITSPYDNGNDVYVRWVDGFEYLVTQPCYIEVTVRCENFWTDIDIDFTLQIACDAGFTNTITESNPISVDFEMESGSDPIFYFNYFTSD